MDDCHTESGAQLFARITSQLRPPIKNLCPEIIPSHGPSQKEIIEITGETNVGKSILLMEFIAQAILPLDCGGKNATAIVIDANSNFQMHRLAPILEKHILYSRMQKSKSNDTEDLRAETSNVKDIVLEALKSIQLFRCYNGDELEMILLKIPDLLTANTKISVLAIDAISDFYWTDLVSTKPIRMDTYLRQLLKRFRKIIDEHGVVLIYTRPSYFVSGSKQGDVSRMTDVGLKIDYRIELVNRSNYEFLDANIAYGEQQNFSRSFAVNDYGIEWISSRKNI